MNLVCLLLAFCFHVSHSTDSSYLFDTKMHFFFRNGFFLTIDQDGKVFGTRERSQNTVFEVLNAGGTGLVYVYNIENKYYLAFNEKGQLYGEQEQNDNAIFEEDVYLNNYNILQSKKYPNWFVGLSKKGKFIPGYKTHKHKRAVRYLPFREPPDEIEEEIFQDSAPVVIVVV